VVGASSPRFASRQLALFKPLGAKDPVGNDDLKTAPTVNAAGPPKAGGRRAVRSRHQFQLAVLDA